MTGVDNCLLESFWVCIFLFSPQKKGTELTIWSDGCVHYLDLGHQFHKVYVYQIVLLCTLHTHNSILFLNKVGGEKQRGRIWDVFLYLILRKYSVIVPAEEKGFRFLKRWKTRKNSSEGGRVIGKWKKLNEFRWTELKGHMEETEVGIRQRSDYTGNKDKDLERRLLNWLAKEGI